MNRPPLRITAASKKGRLARLTAKGDPCTPKDLQDTVESLALNASEAIIAIRRRKNRNAAAAQALPDCLMRTPARIREFMPSPLTQLVYEASDARVAGALARAVLRRLLPREILEIDPGSRKPRRLRPTPPALKAVSNAEEQATALLKSRPILAITDPDLLLIEALQAAWKTLEQANPSLTLRIAGATNMIPVIAKTREKLNILLYQLYLKESIATLTLGARKAKPPPRELAHHATLELELDDATLLTVIPLPPGTINTAGYMNNIISVINEVMSQTDLKAAILPLYPITQGETLDAVSKAINKVKQQKIKMYIY